MKSRTYMNQDVNLRFKFQVATNNFDLRGPQKCAPAGQKKPLSSRTKNKFEI